jgi:hypothetical protein
MRVATHGPIEVRVPTSASLKAVSSRPSGTQNTRPSATRRIFDTMENLFFKEGDELSTPIPTENDFDEVTEVVPYPKSKRKLVIGIAAGAVAAVVLALLIF